VAVAWASVTLSVGGIAISAGTAKMAVFTNSALVTIVTMPSHVMTVGTMAVASARVTVISASGVQIKTRHTAVTILASSVVPTMRAVARGLIAGVTVPVARAGKASSSHRRFPHMKSTLRATSPSGAISAVQTHPSAAIAVRITVAVAYSAVAGGWIAIVAGGTSLAVGAYSVIGA
jgi:hypothetical protein